jgi:hypothetical protein
MLGLVVLMDLLGVLGGIVLTVIQTERRVVHVIHGLLMEVSVLLNNLLNINRVVLGVSGLIIVHVRNLVVEELKHEVELVFVEPMKNVKRDLKALKTLLPLKTLLALKALKVKKVIIIHLLHLLVLVVMKKLLLVMKILVVFGI